MSTKSYTFAVVPKRINSPYWQVVKSGCEIRAKRLTKMLAPANVTCLFVGPSKGGPETEVNQKKIVEDLIDGVYGPIDGLALAVVEQPSGRELIARLTQKDIPVVTFDTDAPNSQRLAYIGTDNKAMGREIGRVLLQTNSDGGKFGIIRAGGKNIQERYEGVREALLNSKWEEVANSPLDCGGNSTLAALQMFELVETNPDIGAILPVGAWPMNEPNIWQNFVDDNRDVITVCGDSLDGQIVLMKMGYANALVGQLPFQMGTFAIDRLLEVRKSQEAGMELPFENAIFPTSFVNLVNIPQDLPPMTIDMNYLGDWVFFGYIAFSIIALLSLGFATFTFVKRKHPTIRKSQPKFLLMLSAGVLILGSTIIPLTFDDGRYSTQACSIACMATPWLASIGFSTVFSALFSKIWRLNKIFHNPKSFERIKVMEKDVIAPFAVLSTANLITLICWTVINPLVYERKASAGTDQWNRVYQSFYGECLSRTDAAGAGLPYSIILWVINFIPVIVANVQAYQARFISVEFQESKYVALATASIFQATIIGLPIVLLLQQQPVPLFVVETILIFITCTAVILLIFMPKVGYLRMYDAEKKERQNCHNGVHIHGLSNPQTAEQKPQGVRFSVMKQQDPDHRGEPPLHQSQADDNEIISCN
eukprot:CAMPEP_0172545676 /NCGR_PEP_ID=MMETSP1067-20121228/15545_1 /TAXON_ID=265564 ORGANISM="Thalassiosira punctigera, Strain Tpunct2005C2" /NCGR_SAMPLE_ID=MMETSP1067 /ASSEMBLY_ACC=CAM_ASM_000444 /LENGTH=649 /DNA_ID=CAMNT_0013332467 /DNA_START=297 /DNA_END=2243 /DNA_ORIENTATION=+